MNHRLRRWLLGWVLALAGAVAGAQTPEMAAEVRPTVTVETGDTGGTFRGRKPDPAKTRHYYLAAESVLWDFAPAGKDEICGLPLPPPLLRERKVGKVRYIQYTDASFSAQVIPQRSLGILGPVLRGLVGEFIAVTFLNRTDQPLSVHPHGVRYDKDSEGAYYFPGAGRGAAVGPGARFTYVWEVAASAGPAPGEPSSKAWLYHSHVGNDETNLGLMGAIVVTDPARARPDGTPRDVDREFATLFMLFDESGLGAEAIEAAEYANLPGLASNAPAKAWWEIQQMVQQGGRSAINGYVFGNLPGLEMNEGERTRWYLFALGSERDFHTAHWHGLRVLEEGRRRTDVIDLLPATMKVADAVADSPGTWLFHCHVADHMREGMFARVTVHARDTIGVDRTPATAFLGYPAGAPSLRVVRVPQTATDRVKFTGIVTVFEGFAVFNEAVRLQVNGKSLEFRPDKSGVARAGDASLRITNANDQGVILGGLMEFELECPLAVGSGSAGEVGMDVARAHHTAKFSE